MNYCPPLSHSFNRGGCANLIILMSELMKILRAFYHYSVLIYVILCYTMINVIFNGLFVSFNVIYGLKKLWLLYYMRRYSSMVKYGNRKHVLLSFLNFFIKGMWCLNYVTKKYILWILPPLVADVDKPHNTKHSVFFLDCTKYT